MRSYVTAMSGSLRQPDLRGNWQTCAQTAIPLIISTVLSAWRALYDSDHGIQLPLHLAGCVDDIRRSGAELSAQAGSIRGALPGRWGERHRRAHAGSGAAVTDGTA